MSKCFPIGSIVHFDDKYGGKLHYTTEQMIVVGYDENVLIVDINVDYVSDSGPINKVSPYEVYYDVRKNRKLKLGKLLKK
jgi:hypothetical protein